MNKAAFLILVVSLVIATFSLKNWDEGFMSVAKRPAIAPPSSDSTKPTEQANTQEHLESTYKTPPADIIESTSTSTLTTSDSYKKYVDLMRDGFPSLVQAARAGEFRIDDFDDRERKTVVRAIIRYSDKEQFLFFVENGWIGTDDHSAFHATIPVAPAPHSEEAAQEKVIIEKLRILSSAGHNLASEVNMIYGDKLNAFDQSVKYGLVEVAEYLANNGVSPAEPDKIWHRMLESGSANTELAHLLLQLGYLPDTSALNGRTKDIPAEVEEIIAKHL